VSLALSSQQFILVDSVADMNIATKSAEVQTTTMTTNMSATVDPTATTTDADASRLCVVLHKNFVLVDGVADMDVGPETTEIKATIMAPNMSATTNATATATDTDTSRFRVVLHKHFILVDGLADMDIAP
jgi:hypothetical protein